MPRLLSILLASAALGCNGPIFVFPGGRLSGEPTATPAEWRFAGDYGTAQLETRPEDPYSVNVTYTVVQGALYVNAGGTESRWVGYLQENPLVRLRLEGALYDLAAERVTDPTEIAAFGRAWTSQSMFRRDPTGFDEVWVYRLVPRMTGS